MTINSGTTLNTGKGALITRAWKPGVISSAGNIREMVTNAEAALTLHINANQGSDADGDYLESLDVSDYGTVVETLDPTGNVFTLILHCKLSTLAPSASYNGLCGLYKAGGLSLITLLQDGAGTSFRADWGPSAATALFEDTTLLLTVNTLTTFVVTNNGTTQKLLITGVSPPTALSDTGAQDTGAATEFAFGAWPGRYYFAGLIDGTALSDVDAQAVANNINAELFDAVGGGGGGATTGRGIGRGIARGIGRGVR